MNGCRLWLQASGTRRNRIRPIPRPSSSAADAFFLSTDVGFIHLHTAVEPIPVGANHRTPQLVEPTPSCLVAAQAEPLLKPQRTPSGFLAGHVPQGLKPHSQGLLGPFKNRPRRQRGSAPTLSTLQVASIRQPGLAASTLRTAEALPPPNPLQKRQTCRLRREPIVELLQGSGIVNAANRMRSGPLSHAGILHLVAGPRKWIPPATNNHHSAGSIPSPRASHRRGKDD